MMAFCRRLIKRIVDRVAAWTKSLEEIVHRTAVLLDLKRSVQLDGFSCGAQSAYMILHYYGKAKSPAATAKALGTDEDGTGTSEILKLFRQRRLKPVIKANARIQDLRSAIDLGSPVLVSLDDEGHWGVVYGYSAGKIFLADPSVWKTRRVSVSIEKFRQRWDRWAMVVAQR